jgi:hypothetical protein
MDHLLAGTEIRLTYLQDRRALVAIDWPTIFDDLIDAGAPPNRCLWCDLDRLTHVVLATDRATGQYAGMLGLVERRADGDSYLLIDAAMTRPGPIALNLATAMLAHALARVASLDGKPAALASALGDRVIGSSLIVLGRNIRSATPFPPSEGNIVALSTARLARRIGPGGIVLDLRDVADASLLRDLRALHRVRPIGVKSGPKRMSPPRPASSGDATPHPRKATRTGKTA